ncbi:MAG: hypothetical protein ACEPOW_07625 [Bacteroidales bacterium]
MTKLLRLSLLLPLLFVFSCNKGDDFKKSNNSLIDDWAKPVSNEIGQMITLSAATYAGRSMPETIYDSVNSVLEASDNVLKQQWKLAWFAFDMQKSLLMFVVKHKTIPNTYTLCIRGDDFSNLFNNIETLNIFQLTNWPYFDSNAKLAQGSMKIFDAFLNIKGIIGKDNPPTITITDFFKKELSDEQTKGRPINLYLSGHSAGAEQVLLFLSYLTHIIESKKIVESSSVLLNAYAFAGTSFVDLEFAKAFEDLYAKYQDSQGKILLQYKEVFNIKDFVSFSAYSNFSQAIYVGYPLSSLFSTELKLLTNDIDKELKKNNIRYIRVGNKVHGTLLNISFMGLSIPKLPEKCNSLQDFASYAGFYHYHNNYAKALGGSSLK